MTDAETPLNHFLVIYDIALGRAEVKTYKEDYDAALEAYTALENEFRGRENFDIVLLGADSLATIKKTHSSYFETREDGFDRFLPPGVLTAV